MFSTLSLRECRCRKKTSEQNDYVTKFLVHLRFFINNLKSIHFLLLIGMIQDSGHWLLLFKNGILWYYHTLSQLICQWFFFLEFIWLETFFFILYLYNEIWLIAYFGSRLTSFKTQMINVLAVKPVNSLLINMNLVWSRWG